MELRIEDLRRGNYISFLGKENCKYVMSDIDGTIYAKSLSQINDDDWSIERDIKDFEPIPITEEWLLKFGFRETHEWIGSYQIYNIGVGDTTINICTNFDGNISFSTNDGWGGTISICEHIKFVHQLQNLFHSLTNEELTLDNGSK
jgi:hypothetical protein